MGIEEDAKKLLADRRASQASATDFDRVASEVLRAKSREFAALMKTHGLALMPIGYVEKGRRGNRYWNRWNQCDIVWDVGPVVIPSNGEIDTYRVGGGGPPLAVTQDGVPVTHLGEIRSWTSYRGKWKRPHPDVALCCWRPRLYDDPERGAKRVSPFPTEAVWRTIPYWYPEGIGDREVLSIWRDGVSQVMTNRLAFLLS